jgi:hypothetical protein
MLKQNHLTHGKFCSRATLYRIILLFGIFVVIYLLTYKIDINSTAILARNILIPVVNFDPNHKTSALLPLIAVTNATSTTTLPSKTDLIAEVTTKSSGLTSELNNSQNASTFVQPKEAFVTFSNNHPAYLALLKVLLDSVHAFSTRPIIAFGIDVDLDINLTKYPRVIKRRIRQSDCGPVRNLGFF